MWFNSSLRFAGFLFASRRFAREGGVPVWVELRQLPPCGVTHVAQHGPCQPGCCCGSSLTLVPVPGDFLHRVLLHSHFIQQRPPQTGMQLAV